MAGIGLRLRAIRRQWQLSLREVEERSLRFAQEQGNQSYQVSASWLDRLEREEHELTVNKLIALADIYNLPTEQLLRSMYPANAQTLSSQARLSGPNATLLLTEGPLEEQAKYLLPTRSVPISLRMRQRCLRPRTLSSWRPIGGASSGSATSPWIL